MPEPTMPGPVMSRVRGEDELRRWHLVMAASFAADFVGHPADPIEESRPALAGLYGDDDVSLFVGEVGGTPVVSVATRLPVHDNLDLANVSVHVHPDHRRRGYGRWAFTETLAIVKAGGRRKVLLEVPAATRIADPSPAEFFATSVGARPMLGEKRRLLDLRALSETYLATLRDEATAASGGYSVVTWRDRTPERFVPDMLVLRSSMSTDPPQGDLDLEPEQWDTSRYLEVEQSFIDRGRQHLVVGAREQRTGRLVGYTDIGIPGGGATVGYQWDTIVAAEHRGHRLGLLLKVANLDQLRHFLPEVRYLNTWNADVNAHMVAINERLGFQPMEGWSEWQLDL